MKEFLLSQAVYNFILYVAVGLSILLAVTVVLLFLWGVFAIAWELSREYRSRRTQEKYDQEYQQELDKVN